MKLTLFAAAFLPLTAAFTFQPDRMWGWSSDTDEPLSNLVPDCTKQPTVSVLNKGTYEGVNGHQNDFAAANRFPEATSAPVPSKYRSQPQPATPQSVPEVSSRALPPQEKDAFFPDPANTPSNPLSSRSHNRLVGTDRAPDQKPESWTMQQW
ncbi:expressed unknown protein [Seminavis robusta]|uniref:Uncharacterized protein n=1 Tax=Seminavis robusta TaxID=568900 RepID=A0A9N8EHW9_9STRA|nr:expressed unknown protein [Seminavis robusta]|eukprot:Sro963_g225260.1 n/a (152) ;mRNA; f:9545-10000